METARGRWFLDEFARTNRNADTAAVLNAVARLEQALIDKAPPATVQSLPEAGLPRDGADNAAFHQALKNIEELIAACAELKPPIDHNLQRLQDMIWALREGGADGRVCNLLSLQTQTVGESVAAMETSMTAVTSAIADLSRHGAPAKADPTGAGMHPPRAAAELAPVVEEASAEDVTQSHETIIGESIEHEDSMTAVLTALEEAIAEASVQEPAPRSSPPQFPQRDILDIASRVSDVAASEPPSNALPFSIAALVELPDAPGDGDSRSKESVFPQSIANEPVAIESLSNRPPANETVARGSLANGSLGAAILAGGLMPRASSLQNDPLAALRRMSQSEKVALFT